MTRLHIANTNFEWELTQTGSFSIEESLAIHPIFLQLQFLPFLYADAQEKVAVSHKPEDSYFHRLEEQGFRPPSLHLFSDKSFPPSHIESWGASLAIAHWAQKHALSYVMPKWDCVKEVNSKEFSFTHAPKLPLSTLLKDEEQALSWLKQTKGHLRVLKTSFGVSGKGHFFIDDSTPHDKAIHFLRKEWQNKRPVIAEPWVVRVFDFSTQWKISQDGALSYLGATLCENDIRGSYRRTLIGDPQSLFGDRMNYLENHLNTARTLLPILIDKGYFGHVGIDAMVYQDPNDPHAVKLHPVVEINARKTMGWVALALQQKYFPDQILALSYSSQNTDRNLLPDFVYDANGKKITFSKKLIAEVRTLEKNR